VTSWRSSLSLPASCRLRNVAAAIVADNWIGCTQMRLQGTLVAFSSFPLMRRGAIWSAARCSRQATDGTRVGSVCMALRSGVDA
jgi:hypothetical protein